MRERKPVSMTADITQQTAPTTHEGILSWVSEIAELTQPDRVHWCTGSDAEWTELTDSLVSTGHLHPAQRGEEAELLLRGLRPHRRGTRRGPHLHLQRRREGRRAHQQLDGPAGDEGAS